MHVIIRLTVISFNPFGIFLAKQNNQHESQSTAEENKRRTTRVRLKPYAIKLNCVYGMSSSVELILNQKQSAEKYNKHHKIIRNKC